MFWQRIDVCVGKAVKREEEREREKPKRGMAHLIHKMQNPIEIQIRCQQREMGREKEISASGPTIHTY